MQYNITIIIIIIIQVTLQPTALWLIVECSQSMYAKLNTGKCCCCIASKLNLNIRANKL